MWPSGKAWVCKTLNDGSNPSVTSQAEFVFSKQSLEEAVSKQETASFYFD